TTGFYPPPPLRRARRLADPSAAPLRRARTRRTRRTGAGHTGAPLCHRRHAGELFVLGCARDGNRLFFRLFRKPDRLVHPLATATCDSAALSPAASFFASS